MKSLGWVLLILGFFCPAVHAPEAGAGLCDPFYKALAPVPHTQLTRETGEFTSLWDQKQFSGCQVIFVTNDRLRGDHPVPDFDTSMENTEMYRAGWRMNYEYTADGAGTGIFGIEKGGAFCLVRFEQPSYVDDKGEIIQDEVLTMKVQCRLK